MIKKYLEFINESLELLLESDVVYSDKFRLAIKKISDNQPGSMIAKKLLDLENKDLDVRSNYFDILRDKNDKVSFIPDRKAQEILSDEKEQVSFSGSGGWLKHKESNSKIFEALGYEYEEGTEPHSPSSSEIGEVIKKTISETSGNTYVWVKWFRGEEIGQGVYNNNKLSLYNQKYKQVWNKNRQDVKVGKAIRALLKANSDEVVDKELEEFVNSFKAQIDKINDKFSLFDVVKGDDIVYWYDHKKYYKQSGTLGSSCMKDGEPYYFDIYKSNPSVCQLIILKSDKNDNKIVGRALLWKLTDGNMFMDRVYSINDSDVNLFREYAKDNGWYSKYYNNSTESVEAISPTGETVTNLSTEIDIRSGYYDGYPYMDTFKWFSTSGRLSTENGDYNLENTDGTLEEECDYCGGSGEYECGECYGSGEITCNKCEGSGEIDCENCNGSGKDGEEECSNCSGSGKEECNICGGSGEEDCDECNGYGDISCYNC